MTNSEINVTKIHTVILIDNRSLPEKAEFNPNLPHNELIFVLNGQSDIKFGDKSFSEKSDYVRFLPKGNNREYTVERLAEGCCIDIFFDTDIPFDYEAFCLKSPHRDKMRSLFIRAEAAWRKKRRGYYHVVMLCLYGIISLLEKEPEYVGKKADRITPGIDYLENNFLKPVNLEDCAALCNMSYAYFKKLFTARFAVSPKSYLIGLRIRHAIDLLSSGLYTVGEVALLCGYKNEFYFSRAFTSYTGYNPSKICAKK